MVDRVFPIAVPKMYFALEIAVMIKKWIVSISICLALVWLINSFVLSVFVVHGSSMEPLLYQGDLIVVKPIINASKFEPVKNDVVVIKEKQATPSIKRIVGLPGDTLVVSNFELVGNNLREVKKPRWVKTTKKEFDWLKNGVLTAVPISTVNDWLVGLTEQEKANLLLRKGVKWVTTPPSFALEKADFVNQINGWSVKDFGPLVVPTTKTKLKLKPNNITIYSKLISEESNLLDSIVDVVSSNGYCFYRPKQDYVFVMGDNRGVSVDSRYFGFLPKAVITGVFVRSIFEPNTVKIANPVSEK